MTEYVGINRASKLLGVDPRHVRRMCIGGKLPGAVKPDGAGGRWQIPITADPRLAAGSVKDNMPGELDNVPPAKKDKALKILGHLKQCEKFAAAHIQNNGSLTEARTKYCSDHNIGRRSFARWDKKFREGGLLGLIDSRGGGKFIDRMVSPEAFDCFKAMYLTQRKLSVKTCYLNLQYINNDQEKGWNVPPLRSFYRYLQATIPLGVIILHREGLATYEAKCAPYIQMDPDSVQPGQVWVGDHHQLNCWVRDRGKWIRPWLTAWEDMRSRSIVGRHVSASPNQTTILLAMKRGIEKYGPPDSVKIDNGRDYDSQMWTGTTKAKRRAVKKGDLDETMVAGLYAMADISVSFSTPYHPQSKPIERFFDTLDCQFTKTFTTYCGKNVAQKPDYLNDLLNSEKAIKEAHTIESFAELLGKYIDAYNHAAHTGQGMDGRSPVQVMATRTSRRVLAKGVLDLLARNWSGELVVGKNGVKFKKMWYGQYSLELREQLGKKVRVAYDPDDIRKVYVYNATTMRLICIAEQNVLVGYGNKVSEDALRLAMRKKTQAIRFEKQFVATRQTANTDLTGLTIKAMAEGRQQPDETAQPTLRPVQTPLNDQVAEHGRQEGLKIVKKAAGTNATLVPDFDFTLLKTTNRLRGEKLFNE